MTTPAYPSATNVYIPGVSEVAGREALVVDFARKPESFKLNKWAQIKPVKTQRGVYITMTLEVMARLLNVNEQDVEWPDETDRPSGAGQTESFVFNPYFTRRKDYAKRLGNLTREQCSWDIIAQHGRYNVMQAMTYRSNAAITAATTSDNYPASHVFDVTTVAGATGRWDQSTSARTDIKRTVDYAASIVRADTNGCVKPEDLQLVMGPECARRISITQEIVDTVKQSPFAMDYINGKLGPNAYYGLPPVLYGYNVVVEDTYLVTTRKGNATQTHGPALASSTPFLCSRPGGLNAPESGPSFSTHTVMMKEEMTVEIFDDNKQRRVELHVVEDFQSVVTAPVSGISFTNATS